MVVAAKVCELTDGFLWFVCGLYVGILTSPLSHNMVHCAECIQGFTQCTEVETHITEDHGGETVYSQCFFCKRGFTKQSDLEIHMTTPGGLLSVHANSVHATEIMYHFFSFF